MRRLAASAVLCIAAAAAVTACDPPGADPTSVAPVAPKPPPREVRLGASTTGTRAGGLVTPNNLFWGDLHVHTAYSVDAYSFGTRATPADAYRFARNVAPVTIAAGAPTPGPVEQISRPLHFSAVTDHSEWLISSYACGADAAGNPFDPGNPYFGSAACQYYRSDLFDPEAPLPSPQQALCTGGLPLAANCINETRSAWAAVRQAANIANLPGAFTAFIGYEWTHFSPSPEQYTLHRNVIFAGTDVPDVPFDALDYPDPVQLWDALDTGCGGGGAPCQALTIPHNSNMSGGLAFDIPGPPPGNPAVIDQMRRYQRLAEVYQHKGSSECYHDPASPQAIYNQDPSCLFENTHAAPYVPAGFVRTALANGVVREWNGLNNPWRLGMVGSTDTHNATPGNVDEDGWPGHVGTLDRLPQNRLTSGSLPKYSAGGLTGVWAEENTRPAIYQALHDREVFATSGPRIAVRFYQTWNPTQFCSVGSFPDNILNAVPAPVPMGGTFTGLPALTPYFVVSAAADVADLQEVDLIKIDVDPAGQPRSSVTRITLNGAAGGGMNRSVTAPCIWVSDPSYDPAVPAVYYARVLEVPTPRWSARDCTLVAPGSVPDCGNGVLDTSIRERAWTSPIWSVLPQ